MLILTRQVGEKIAIGDNVAVTVLDVRQGQARLGVEAEKSVQVHREEVYMRINHSQPDNEESQDGAA